MGLISATTYCLPMKMHHLIHWTMLTLSSRVKTEAATQREKPAEARTMAIWMTSGKMTMRVKGGKMMAVPWMRVWMMRLMRGKTTTMTISLPLQMTQVL